jgi:hypothetical protein
MAGEAVIMTETRNIHIRTLTLAVMLLINTLTAPDLDTLVIGFLQFRPLHTLSSLSLWTHPPPSNQWARQSPNMLKCLSIRPSWSLHIVRVLVAAMVQSSVNQFQVGLQYHPREGILTIARQQAQVSTVYETM